MSDAITRENLIKRLANDDRLALDELFRYYYPRLYRFLQHILKSESEIDDILQDVFFKIWMNRTKINHVETFNSFIFTIAKNAAINVIRVNIRHQKFRDELFSKSVLLENTTQRQVEFDEMKKAIDGIIGKLPEKRRQVFLLSRNVGLSNKEIARQLDISVKTVEDHVTQAVKYIKKNMAEMGMLPLLYFYLFL